MELKLLKKIIAHITALSYFCASTSLAAIPTHETAKVLLQSADASEEEFKKFLDTSPSFISLESVRPDIPESSISQLHSVIELANSEFTSDSTEKAFELFKQATKMALDQDWEEEERKLIFTAFFRQAQLEPQSAQKFVRKAILFDPTLVPDPEFIPVSLQELYNDLQEEIEKEFISFTPATPSTYYINGLKNFAKIHPLAFYRITYISNIYGLKTEFSTGKNANEIFPFGIPIAQGQCSNIITTNPEAKSFKKSFVYASGKCSPKLLSALALKTQNELHQSEAQLVSQLPSKEESAQDLSLNLYPSSMNAEEIALAEAQSLLPTQKSKTTLSKRQKTWIALGAGAIALTLGAMLIQRHGDKPQDYEPTQSSGF